MIYFVYLLIPIFVIINSLKNEEKSVKKARIFHAIPSYIFLFVFIGFFIYTSINKMKFSDFIEKPGIFFIPIAMLVISVITYISGKNKERYLFMDIGGKEVEEVRYRKATDSNTINISSKDLED